MQSKRTDLYDMKKPELSYVCLSLQGQKKWEKKCLAHLLPHPPGEDIPTI